MNLKFLNQIIENTSDISEKNINILKKEISKNKYCPILYAILCKIYINYDSLNYEKALKFASLYSPDRSKLKKYLEDIDEEFKKNIKIESIDENDFVGEDLSRESKTLSVYNPTETLAQIFEKKGEYLHAIQIYKQLSLNFPKKKLYFTNIINKLKNKKNLELSS